MIDYSYVGLTAYIKTKNMGNVKKLKVIAEAIRSLQPDFEHVTFDEKEHQSVVSSDDYKFLCDNENLCYPNDDELPNGTPDAYKRPMVHLSTIKGETLIRLYVPAVSRNYNQAKHFTNNALHAVLLELFGDELIGIKTKEQIAYKEFQHGEEHVLVSADR